MHKRGSSDEPERRRDADPRPRWVELIASDLPGPERSAFVCLLHIYTVKGVFLTL